MEQMESQFREIVNLDINEAMPLFFTAMVIFGMKVYG